jgi:hypothetical protein
MNNYVTVAYSVGEDALTWVKENCPGYITNKYHVHSGDVPDLMLYYDFFFDPTAKEDMTAFKLKWVR